MRLKTERSGRWLARRVLLRLANAGPEACRADESRRAQPGAMRAALFRLFQDGTPAAVAGFSSVLVDALGTRSHTDLRELVLFYEHMEKRYRRRRDISRNRRTGDNVSLQTFRR